MNKHVVRGISALALGVAAQGAWAVPPPPISLNNCQNAVKVATAQFVSKKVAAIGTCLQAVSTQIIKNNAPDASAAASTCVAQFRKLNDSRGLDKQLSDKLAVAITKKCTPGRPGVTHTLADIIGAGAGVMQPLNAENLNAWCSHYGGDGSIDTLQEWTDCIGAAAECDVDSAIVAQYPRVLDWLNLVRPPMHGLMSPGSDPNKIADALAGLDAVKAEIGGPDNDNVVSLQCGGIVASGTAVAGNVLAGKTFSNSTAGGVTGTMPNNGAVTLTPGTSNQTIAAGYHNGSGYCAGDANLVTGNIKSGATIFGVSGNPNVVNTSSGTAAASDLLTGKIAWVAGAQVNGAMPNNGAVTLMPGTSSQTIVAGYHNGSGYCAGDANLVTGNIKSGATIFGVSGNPNVVNTSSGTAAASDVLTGKIAWVAGTQITGTGVVASGNAAAADVLSGKTFSNASGGATGTMPNNGTVNITPGTSPQTISAGYHSGSGTVAGDADLVAANIENGVNIFGVVGTAVEAKPVRTGETQCDEGAGTLGSCPGSPAGQDGSLQKGAARSFTDNGDGTITDNKTGLMWEKLDNNPSGMHSYATNNNWYHAFTIHVATLNSSGGFAGHTDWRLPNINELQSIIDYGTFSPAVYAAAFNTNCVANCTVDGAGGTAMCSCTQSSSYWSSTTYRRFLSGGVAGAWAVVFDDGYGNPTDKGSQLYVRAVRGGS